MSVTTERRDTVVADDLVALRAELTTDFARADRRGRRRSILIVVVGVLLVLGGTATAIAAVTSAGPTNAIRQVTCYEKAKLTSHSVGVGLGTRRHGPDRGQPVPLADPIEQCQAIWQGGFLGEGAQTATSVVPPLAVCVTESGVAAVLPMQNASDDSAALCNRLGIAPWPGS